MVAHAQIESSHQRIGVGALLLRTLEALARHTRMHKVLLTVFTFNVSAQSFFKKCGYTLDETDSSSEDRDCDYNIMSKAVTNTE
jgi:GNAT superfamily N-acetyltransferase